MDGVRSPAAPAGSKGVGARLRGRAQVICPAGASAASAPVEAADIRASAPAAISRVRRLVMGVSLATTIKEEPRARGWYQRRDSHRARQVAHRRAEGPGISDSPAEAPRLRGLDGRPP